MQDTFKLLINNGANDAVQDHGVSADVPAGFEPDPGVNASDCCHPLDVIRLVCAGGDNLPMLDLAIFGVSNMSIVRKEFCRFRMFRHFRVKRVERMTDSRTYDGLHVCQAAALAFIKAHKIEAVLQVRIACLNSHRKLRFALEAIEDENIRPCLISG